MNTGSKRHRCFHREDMLRYALGMVFTLFGVSKIFSLNAFADAVALYDDAYYKITINT